MALIARTLQIDLLCEGFCLFVCLFLLVHSSYHVREMLSNEFLSIIYSVHYSKNVNKHTHFYTYLPMYMLHNPQCINKIIIIIIYNIYRALIPNGPNEKEQRNLNCSSLPGKIVFVSIFA